MDGANISSLQHTFIVRLWANAHAANAPQWRGSVEHVASGQRFYFTSLGDLEGFIARQLKSSSAHSQDPFPVQGGSP